MIPHTINLYDGDFLKTLHMPVAPLKPVVDPDHIPRQRSQPTDTTLYRMTARMEPGVWYTAMEVAKLVDRRLSSVRELINDRSIFERRQLAGRGLRYVWRVK